MPVTPARALRLGPRDVMVTGMGFCLPGEDAPVFTAKDLWEIASHGRSCLRSDGIYHSKVKLSPTEFAEVVPDVPGTFAQHYTAAHRFGLVSLAKACADAGLDFRAGDLSGAAILAGRGGVDANVDSYLAALRADPDTITETEAMDLFVGTEQAGSPSDVVLVQAALTRSVGPCFTASAGCA